MNVVAIAALFGCVNGMLEYWLRDGLAQHWEMVSWRM